MMEGWKKDKLLNICNVYQPQTISKKQLIKDGEYLVYGANGVIGRYNKYNHEESEVLLTCRGATCGTINLSTPKSWINGNAMVVKPIDKSIIDKQFLFFLLQGVDFKSIISGAAQPQITRQSLNPLEILFPSSLPEQRKIAYILSTVQKAIEQQDKLIKITTELKKALMQKLFTEGLYGEKQKQTEIGLVPESWEVDKLGQHSQIKTSYPTLKKVIEKFSLIKNGEIFHYLKVSDMNLIGNEIYIKSPNITFKNNELINFSKGFLKPDSLIFPKRGAAISTNKKRITTKYSVLDPNLIGIEPNPSINVKFLYYYFEMFDLINLQDNNVIPQLNKHNVANVTVPIPKIEEQLSIVSNIEALERKIYNYKKKKQTLQDLFKTLLHELMTGQRRVNEIDFGFDLAQPQDNKEEPLPVPDTTEGMAAESEMKYNKGEE